VQAAISRFSRATAAPLVGREREGLNAAGRLDDTLAAKGAPGRAGERGVAMTEDEERELRGQLARLQQEHRDLDAAIEALATTPGSDIIQVQRLKKRKLQLRDRITFIEDQLTPDIIA
jgi:hypothetical protein